MLCAKRVENGFLHTLGIISVILHAIHTCAENAADLSIFGGHLPHCDITRVLCSYDDDDNEHVLLSKSRGWCYGVSPQRGVGLLRRPGQECHVL